MFSLSYNIFDVVSKSKYRCFFSKKQAELDFLMGKVQKLLCHHNFKSQPPIPKIKNPHKSGFFVGLRNSLLIFSIRKRKLRQKWEQKKLLPSRGEKRYYHHSNSDRTHRNCHLHPAYKQHSRCNPPKARAKWF